MKKTISFYFILYILIMGCSTTTIIKSYRQLNNDRSDQISGVDERSKIQWRIANDDKKLYFRFESSDKSIHRMLLRNGFTLIIDTSGHKDEVFTFIVSNRPKSGVVESNDFTPMGKPDQNNYNKNVRGSFKEALWKEEDSEQLIDLIFDKTDFSASYKIDSFDLIVCNATIPLSAIKTKGLIALNKLSIGLKIEPGQRPSHRNGEEDFGDETQTQFDGNRNGTATGMNEYGGGEMDRGGMNGGMGRGGMGRGMGGRHGGGGMNKPGQNSNSVDFWFVTELAK